jgi:hypothetical protein
MTDVLLVYCAAHRQIVKLSEAEQTPEGRYVCRVCRDAGRMPTDRACGHMTIKRGQDRALSVSR